MRTEKLFERLGNHEVVLSSVQEDFLDYFLVFLSGGPSEIVEVNVEVLVDFLVNFEVFVANFLRSLLAQKSLDLCRRAILVSATNVETVVSSESAVTRVDICRQNGPDQITEMGLVVDVGKSRGDEDIPLSLDDIELGILGSERNPLLLDLVEVLLVDCVLLFLRLFLFFDFALCRLLHLLDLLLFGDLDLGGHFNELVLLLLRVAKHLLEMIAVHLIGLLQELENEEVLKGRLFFVFGEELENMGLVLRVESRKDPVVEIRVCLLDGEVLENLGGAGQFDVLALIDQDVQSGVVFFLGYFCCTRN